MTITTNQSQACFDAWIQCESMLTALSEAPGQFSRKLSKVVDECALICMGTFHAMKSRSVNLANMALLCVGICEECAEICEYSGDPRLGECARICRECSQNLSKLASDAGWD